MEICRCTLRMRRPFLPRREISYLFQFQSVSLQEKYDIGEKQFLRLQKTRSSIRNKKGNPDTFSHCENNNYKSTGRLLNKKLGLLFIFDHETISPLVSENLSHILKNSTDLLLQAYSHRILYFLHKIIFVFEVSSVPACFLFHLHLSKSRSFCLLR